MENQPINLAEKKFYEAVTSVIVAHTPHVRPKSKFPFWFSTELRQTMRNMDRARKRFKKTKIEADYARYSVLRAHCKTLLKADNMKYIERLQLNVRSNIKLFFAFTKSKKQTNTYPAQFEYNDVLASENDKICELFRTFFQSTYSVPPYPQSASNAAPSIPYDHPIINCRSFNENEITLVLNSLDINKNGGPDGIPNLFLKRTAASIAKPLKIILNRSIISGVFPDEFKVANVTPIFKKGEKQLISNYRPISMLNTISLVFEKMVRARISENIDN